MGRGCIRVRNPRTKIEKGLRSFCRIGKGLAKPMEKVGRDEGRGLCCVPEGSVL